MQHAVPHELQREQERLLEPVHHPRLAERVVQRAPVGGVRVVLGEEPAQLEEAPERVGQDLVLLLQPRVGLPRLPRARRALRLRSGAEAQRQVDAGPVLAVELLLDARRGHHPVRGACDERLGRGRAVRDDVVRVRCEPVDGGHLARAPEGVQPGHGEGERDAPRAGRRLDELVAQVVAVLGRLAVVERRRLDDEPAEQAAEHAGAHQAAGQVQHHLVGQAEGVHLVQVRRHVGQRREGGKHGRERFGLSRGDAPLGVGNRAVGHADGQRHHLSALGAEHEAESDDGARVAELVHIRIFGHAGVLGKLAAEHEPGAVLLHQLAQRPEAGGAGRGGQQPHVLVLQRREGRAELHAGQQGNVEELALVAAQLAHDGVLGDVLERGAPQVHLRDHLVHPLVHEQLRGAVHGMHVLLRVADESDELACRQVRRNNKVLLAVPQHAQHAPVQVRIVHGHPRGEVLVRQGHVARLVRLPGALPQLGAPVLVAERARALRGREPIQHKHRLDPVLLQHPQVLFNVADQCMRLPAHRHGERLLGRRRGEQLPQVVRQVDPQPRVLQQRQTTLLLQPRVLQEILEPANHTHQD